MTVVYHPHASSELGESALYLERQREGLCDEFFEAVETVEEQIKADSSCGTPYLCDTRRIRIGKFAYAVIFREEKDRVMIYAIASYSRNEGYWMERIP